MNASQFTLLESREPDRILTAEEAGLEEKIKGGPEKLLAALVKWVSALGFT